MAEDAEVKIKLTADARPAEGAVKRLKGALDTCARGIGAFTKALGVVGFAIQGIQLVWGAFKTLHEWMTKDREAAEKLRREMEQARYERGVEKAAKAYKELNAEIERTIRLEKERAATRTRQTTDRRDAEDARLELAKQREIAALDPASEDYVRRKREIEDRYAAKAAGESAARSKEDRDAELEVMRKELAARERQVAGQKASRDADLKEADAARREIERREVARQPFRPRQRVLDGKTHVRPRKLRHHRTVDEADHRMHDRLRVQHHLDALRLHPEKVPRLDQFQCLVCS